MSSRMRRPETVKLEITRGDWLLVKKHLTAGEQRRVFKRMLNGVAIEPINVGLSKIVGYLLDWSVTDADDQPVVIRDQDPDTVASALDALDTDSFKEILNAIEAHETAMEAEREAEKKMIRTGESTSLPSSSSAPDSTGDTNGLTTSQQMSIA